MSAVERLRQNDPARTRILIRLSDEPSDADLAQALEQNLFVTEIHLKVEGVQTTDWGALLRVIVARDSLELVMLTAATGPQRYALALVRALLQAIQQNNSIRFVLLQFLASSR